MAILDCIALYVVEYQTRKFVICWLQNSHPWVIRASFDQAVDLVFVESILKDLNCLLNLVLDHEHYTKDVECFECVSNFLGKLVETRYHVLVTLERSLGIVQAEPALAHNYEHAVFFDLLHLI